MRTHISSEHGEDAGEEYIWIEKVLEYSSGLKGLTTKHRSDHPVITFLPADQVL